MSEFEKWDRKSGLKWDPKHHRKNGWTGALQWALTHKRKITDAQFQAEASIEMIDASILEQELEDFEK